MKKYNLQELEYLNKIFMDAYPGIMTSKNNGNSVPVETLVPELIKANDIGGMNEAYRFLIFLEYHLTLNK